MPLWILTATGAYLLLALNGVADKFLLSKAVKSPVTYAFFTGITGPLVWVLAPFGLKFLSLPDLLIAILAGVCFIVALVFLFRATQQTSASRISPIEGGLVPLFTLLFAYLILHEHLTQHQLYAFVLLVLGAVLISIREENNHWHAPALGNAIVAAMLFAMSFTLEKHTYGVSNFVSGLVWTRVGFLVASLSFLIPPKNRKDIFQAPKKTSSGNKALYYGARVSGAFAGLLQHFSISIGSVTLVNALQGTQFAFLLVVTSVLSKKFPKILKEKITPKIITQKIIAIVLVSIGLTFLII
jgi:uncharacterized membrane protein